MKYSNLIKNMYKNAAARRGKKKLIEDDLGDGIVAEYEAGDTRSAQLAQRVRELSRPMTFGDSVIDSLPVALLCAGIGGVGSMAISKGDIGAGVAGALASGTGTLLLNAIPNTGRRKMSVSDAFAKAQDEFGKTASQDKRAYYFKDLKHPDNSTTNKVVGAVVGGALGGGTGYGVGMLCSKEKTVRLLAALVGAGIGGVGGYALGGHLGGIADDRATATRKKFESFCNRMGENGKRYPVMSCASPGRACLTVGDMPTGFKLDTTLDLPDESMLSLPEDSTLSLPTDSTLDIKPDSIF